MAVRELLSIANFFHSALELARKGEDTNESSVFYGLNSQVMHSIFFLINQLINLMSTGGRRA